MKKQDILNKNRLYGDLICHFANASTSDEAGLTFLEDIKKAFGFPDKVPAGYYFDERGERIYDYRDDECYQFPTMETFKSRLDRDEILDEKQKQLIRDFLEKHPSHLHYSSMSTSYNRFPNIKRDHHIYVERDPMIYYSIQKSAEYLGEGKFVAHNVGTSGPQSKKKGGSWKDKGDGILSFDTSFEKKIRSYLGKNKIPEKISQRIEHLLYWYCEELEPEHNHIKKITSSLKNLLDAIAHTGNYTDADLSTLVKYNELYNEGKFSDYAFTNIKDDGSINIMTYPLFDAVFFINRFQTNPHLCLEDYYDKPIAYCLIEFLKEQNNINYLKKCSDCQHFFLKAKRYKEQKYCPTCSKRDHTPKEEKAKRQREIYRPSQKKKLLQKKESEIYQAQLNRLIQSGKWKLEEAKREARRYVKEQLSVKE
jgi:hypothetical protein